MKPLLAFDKPMPVCIILLLLLVSSSCRKTISEVPLNTGNSNGIRQQKPNIVLILVDDIGYEVPTCNGGQSYSTPTIDLLAKRGIRFTQCQSCPNCSPSRIELITGKYNFRNYFKWGTLDTAQKTFVNMLHDAGYTTCVAGKWQFDGGDASIHKFGFDKYAVFLPFNPGNENAADKYRYKNPMIYENASYLPDSTTKGKYADDMFADYISNFIDSNRNKSFFIYYPTSLCHQPFCPTPDDPQYAAWDPLKDKSDTTYFPSMVQYMDKKINQVIKKIASDGLANNTIIFFVGDNGTPVQITSVFKGQKIQGGKATSTQYGTHVPLSVTAPGRITGGQTSNALIDFTDFFPTIAQLINSKNLSAYNPLDGVSFAPIFNGDTTNSREWSYCWWNPQYVQPIFRVWSQTSQYKLYDTTNANNFYNIVTDPLELSPIPDSRLTLQEVQIKNTLSGVLASMHN